MWRFFAVGSLLTCLMPPAASARPIAVSELVELAVLVPEDLLLRLLERRGLDGQLGAQSVRELADAGFSDAFISRLVELTRPVPEIDGIEYRVVDGVLRVSGEGPEAGGEAVASERVSTGSQPDLSAPDQVDDAGIVFNQAATVDAGEDLMASGYANPYPSGAAGWGSAVFVPARYGNPPSSFGTTIVSAAAVLPQAYDAWRVSRATPARLDFADTARSYGHLIPIRTSRGTIWVPN